MASNRDKRRHTRAGPDRGATAADGRIEGRAWLDNPENLRRFFDGVARASQRAQVRERNRTRD